MKSLSGDQYAFHYDYPTIETYIEVFMYYLHAGVFEIYLKYSYQEIFHSYFYINSECLDKFKISIKLNSKQHEFCDNESFKCISIV